MICSWCSDAPFSESVVIEKPDEPLRERLTDVAGIDDPAHLAFCGAECQQRFHTNLRRLGWNEHEATCACVTCLG